MPTFLASYDLKKTVPDPHEKFVKQAAERAWYAWKPGNDGYLWHLPNTTLEGDFDTKDQAVSALKEAREATERELGIKVTMEKWIVVQFTGYTMNSDEKTEI